MITYCYMTLMTTYDTNDTYCDIIAVTYLHTGSYILCKTLQFYINKYIIKVCRITVITMKSLYGLL